MFRDLRMMRSMLVLDGDNHFEGYTNSDGVEFDGGLSPLASTHTHTHKPASPLFLCAANSCACCRLRAPLPSLSVSGRRASRLHSIPSLLRLYAAYVPDAKVKLHEYVLTNWSMTAGREDSRLSTRTRGPARGTVQKMDSAASGRLRSSPRARVPLPSRPHLCAWIHCRNTKSSLLLTYSTALAHARSPIAVATDQYGTSTFGFGGAGGCSLAACSS